jgi:hypothetical protein
VSRSPGFAEFDILVIQIPDLADGAPTLREHESHFSGWQPKERVALFMRHHLGDNTCAANHLGAFARAHFDVVHKCTGRQILQFGGVADRNAIV